MDSNYIVSRMNAFLHHATKVLIQWLEPRLTCQPEWWEDCVLKKLSDNQKEEINKKKNQGLSALDLSALLRIADKNWYIIKRSEFLPPHYRESIQDMRAVRNNWAHCSGILPGKDSIINDLAILRGFFDCFDSSEEVKNETIQFREMVETPGAVPAAFTETMLPSVPKPALKTAGIQKGKMVCLAKDPSKKGAVLEIRQIGKITEYTVFIDGGMRTFYEEDILPEPETENRAQWTSISNFQCFLSAYQINHPSAENLYSLNSARIDFVPYQFRPAMKLIQADQPRILIADSVGVGKTIEAGLIIKELEARALNGLEKILIICPKPLVAERKWELEMKRFDEEFVSLDGTALRTALSDTDRDGEWPEKYAKAIIPYSILDAKAYGEEGKRGSRFGLVNLDPPPHFDLVIIDEAHHLRNGSMEKQKAFAYKGVKTFCDNADAVVMLTATPLQTSDNDLFVLLNLLRPDIVYDKAAFDIMARPNEYIARCAHIVRGGGENWQDLALEQLSKVWTTQWGEDCIVKNPLYQQVTDKLKQANLTKEERVNLITDIERLHSFNTLMNRTRRKDIQDFCVRRSHTIETEFTASQRALHDELLEVFQLMLSLQYNPRIVPFLISQIRRQAASCIYGLAPFIRDIIAHRLSEMNDDPYLDPEIMEPSSEIYSFLQENTKKLFEMARNLPDEDPKFESVLSIIQQKQNEANNKIILFSTFRHTLSYLQKKLEAQGIRVAQINGSIRDEQRRIYRDRFGLAKDDPNALDMLLFTEVGSEGLDYQFCDTMINYDLPWNPMSIEQRIGRIDRRGQKSEAVNIYNAITKETIDADIYERCLLRIGVFESSIGDCDMILGKIANEIKDIAVDVTLTEEERKKKYEQIADNEVREMQEYKRLEEEQKGLFGIDISEHLMSKNIQNAENPWLTPRGLQTLTQQYLVGRIGKENCIQGQNLRLSLEDRAELLKDCKALSIRRSLVRDSWEQYLKKGRSPNHGIVFDSEGAAGKDDAFFINATHPLVKQAAAFYQTDDIHYLNLRYSSSSIPAGKYPFCVYIWNYSGDRSYSKLKPFSTEPSLQAELLDILHEASDVPFEETIADKEWEAIEELQAIQLKTEKKRFAEEAHQRISYKLESLKISYQNRCHVLESQINAAQNEKILRIKEGEQKNAEIQFNQKASELHHEANKADVNCKLLAKGYVNVYPES